MTRVACILTLMIGCASDAVVPMSGDTEVPRPVWRDADGRVIASISDEGELLLITRDLDGRIVTVEFLRGPIDTSGPGIPCGGVSPRVHSFLYDPYDPAGHLVEEVDCRGDAYPLPAGETIDEFRGTALKGHKHLEVEK